MEDHELPPLNGGPGGFEKRVHQKMADMELIPSATVWEKVDERLHPENKRRRWLVWLMFLLAGLSLGGYLFWNSFNSSFNKQASLAEKNTTNKITTNKARITSEKEETAKRPASAQIQNNSIGQSLTSKKENNKATKSEEKIFLNEKEVSHSKNSSGIQRDSHSKSPESTIAFTKDTGKITIRAVKKSGEANSNKIKNEDNPVFAWHGLDRSKQHPDPVIETSDPALKMEAVGIMNPEPTLVRSQVIQVGQVNTSLGLMNASATSTVSKIKMKRTPGLSWGLNLVVGKSSASSGSFNSLFQSSSPMDNSALNNSNGGLPQGNANLPVPSALKAGYAFKAGIFVKRQLTSRLSMSLGLNYNLYTLSNMVGQKIDTAISLTAAFAADQKTIDQYFKTGNSQKYTSRYHFVELPVLLHAKLAANERVPVSFDLGFSISRLISSNALYYNNNSGIYYNDNSLFNKTQFNLVTGLPIRIFSSKEFSLDAGPHFQYGITNLLADSKTGSKHFIFLGLKAGILIKKK